MDAEGVRAIDLYRRKLYGASLAEWARAREAAARAGSDDDVLQALNGAFSSADALRLTKDARELSLQAMEVSRGLSPGHPLGLIALFNFALAAAKTGNFDDAERAVLLIQEKAELPSLEDWRHVFPITELLKLNVLIDRGDYPRAADQMARTEEIGWTGRDALLVQHARALLAMETGRPEEAVEQFRRIGQAFAESGGVAERLILLTDLGQAQALMDDPEGVTETVKEANDLVAKSPCALDGLEIGRLAALDAFALGLTGQLRELRHRLAQVQAVLEGFGRRDEADRLVRRVIRFSSRFAGHWGDLHTDANPLFSFFESPYVLWKLFADAGVAPLSVYVRELGPELAEDVDRTILEQAAVTPFTERSWHVRQMSEGLTGLPGCPEEAKVLAVLRDYAEGLKVEGYAGVLEHLWKARGRRYDEAVLRRLVDLHVA